MRHRLIVTYKELKPDDVIQLDDVFDGGSGVWRVSACFLHLVGLRYEDRPLEHGQDRLMFRIWDSRLIAESE